MKKHVYYTLKEEIALITMDSPPANAFSDPLHRDFLGVLDELKGLPVRAAIITGSGRFFQAGGDMKRFLELKTLDEAKTFVRAAQDFMDDIAAMACPTIAAINGFALGGGLEIALACDIRIAAADAFLGLPEVRYGILSGAGGTQRLARLIGLGKAKRLMFTGRRISADEALGIGLVDSVTASDQLLPEAFDLAKEIAANSPMAVQHVKRCVDEGIDLPLSQGLAVERNYWAELIPHGDYLEGVNAWFEKRRPVFNYPKPERKAGSSGV